MIPICRSSQDALQVLLFAGSFPHEHQFRLLVANAEDQVGPGLAKAAFHAAAAFLPQFVHRRHSNISFPFAFSILT